MTQAEAILAHLKAGNTITPIEALDKFGCFRLAARIIELRRDGYNIVTEGDKNYAVYRLIGGISKAIPANSFKEQPELLNFPTIPIISHV